MFGGINIDLSQLQASQDLIKECSSHPKCEGCKYYKLPKQGDMNICETAVMKLRGEEQN